MKKKTGHIESAADASLTTKRQPRPQPPIDADAAREWEDAIVKKGGRIQRIQVRCTHAELEYAAACGASWRDLAELIGCTDQMLRHWRRMTRNLANDVDAQSLAAEQRKALGTGRNGRRVAHGGARRRYSRGNPPAGKTRQAGQAGRGKAPRSERVNASSTTQFPLFPFFGKTRETPNRPN